MPLAYAGLKLRAAAFLVDAAMIAGVYFLAVTVTGSRIAAALPGVLYLALAQCSSGQATLGMRLFGIRLMEANGRRVTLPRAILRTTLQMSFWIALIPQKPWLTALALATGLIALVGIWRGTKHRAWYDRLAGTAVIQPPA